MHNLQYGKPLLQLPIWPTACCWQYPRHLELLDLIVDVSACCFEWLTTWVDLHVAVAALQGVFRRSAVVLH